MTNERRKRGRPRIYDRKEGETGRGAPRLTIRVDPDIYNFIQTRPQGARAYVEQLVREKIAEMLVKARQALEEELERKCNQGPGLANAAGAVDNLRHLLEDGGLLNWEEVLNVEAWLNSALARHQDSKRGL